MKWNHSTNGSLVQYLRKTTQGSTWNSHLKILRYMNLICWCVTHHPTGVAYSVDTGCFGWHFCSCSLLVHCLMFIGVHVAFFSHSGSCHAVWSFCEPPCCEHIVYAIYTHDWSKINQFYLSDPHLGLPYVTHRWKDPRWAKTWKIHSVQFILWLSLLYLMSLSCSRYFRVATVFHMLPWAPTNPGDPANRRISHSNAPMKGARALSMTVPTYLAMSGRNMGASPSFPALSTWTAPCRVVQGPLFGFLVVRILFFSFT